MTALRRGQSPQAALAELRARQGNAPAAKAQISAAALDWRQGWQQRLQESSVPLTESDITALEAQLLLDLDSLDQVEAGLRRLPKGHPAAARVQAVQAPMRQSLQAALTELDSLRGNPKATLTARDVPALWRWLRQAEPAPRILGLRKLPNESVSLAALPLPEATNGKPSFADDQAAPGSAADIADPSADTTLPGVIAKAQELQYQYPELYDLVRSQIRTEWYPGTQKDPDEVLRTGAGNSTDQTRLLVALFRVSSAPTRFVHARLSLSLPDLESWTNQQGAAAVSNLLTAAGIAHEPVVQGAQVVGFRIEQVIASAYVPYNNYRGVTAETSGKVWVPLAPGIKPHALRAGRDVLTEAAITADSVWADYLADTSNQLPLTLLENRLSAFLAQQTNPQLLSNVIRKREVVADPIGLLPANLPGTWAGLIYEGANLPATAPRLKVALNGEVLGELPLDALKNQRLTLSWQPATSDDQDLIQAMGGFAQTPAYLFRMRARLMQNGEPVGTSQATFEAGNRATLSLSHQFLEQEQQYQQQVVAGAYLAIAHSVQGAQVEPEVDDDPDGEFNTADYLAQLGTRYLEAWSRDETRLAAINNVELLRPWPALALVTLEHTITQIDGRPQFMRFKGVSLDALVRPLRPIGTSTNEKRFLQMNALQGSALESQIFQDQWSVNAISADRALRAVDATNRVTQTGGVLPASVQLPTEVETEINAQLAQGWTVDTILQPVTQETWTGAGWRATDPLTGASGYFISGGYAGGSTTSGLADWLVEYLVDEFGSPYSPPAHDDINRALRLEAIRSTDQQVVEVDNVAPIPLAVRLTDIDAVPIRNVTVTFKVELGNGTLSIDGNNFSQTMEVATDQFGVASVQAKPDKSITFGMLVFSNEGDEFPTIASLNTVVAEVALPGGQKLVIDRPLSFFGKPGQAEQLVEYERPYTFSHDESPDRPISLVGVPIGRWHLGAVDQHGNAVSNVAVTFSSSTREWAEDCDLNGRYPYPHLPAVFYREDECLSPQFPAHGSCGSPTLTIKTKHDRGAIANVINSTMLYRDVDYRATADSIGVTKSFDTRNLCTLPRLILIKPYVNSRGTIIEAARPFKPVGYRREIAIYKTQTYYHNGLPFGGTYYLPGDPLPPFYLASCGQSGTLEPLRRDFPGRYSTTFTGGVGAADCPLDFQNPLPFSPDPELNPYRGVLAGFKTIDMGINRIAPVELTPDGYPSVPIEVSVFWSAPPAQSGNGSSYPILPAIVIYREGEEWISWSASNLSDFAVPSGVATISIPKLFKFDPAKDYEAELVFHRSSPAALRSEKVKLDFSRSVIAGMGLAKPEDIPQRGLVGQFPKELDVYAEMDISEPSLCPSDEVLAITLHEDSRMVIQTESYDEHGNPSGLLRDLFSEDEYVKGTHTFPVSWSDRPPGRYKLHIKATDLTTDDTEELTPDISFDLHRTDSRSLGHPFFKNVDLFKGTLALSRQDVSLGGRGPGLRFERTYVSDKAAATKVGLVGFGWSTNLEYGIQTDRCGAVTVFGADGGAQRFRPISNSNDVTEYKPVAGYHGSLVRRGQTYSYYAIDGTHYLFQNVGFGYELTSISDPNENKVQYEYEGGVSGATGGLRFENSRRVKKIKDDAGRELVFEYQVSPISRPIRLVDGEDEVNAFLAYQLTKITGPGGLVVNYRYDRRGYLIEVGRSGAGGCAPNNCERYEYGSYQSVSVNSDSETTKYHLAAPLTAVVNVPDGARTKYDYDLWKVSWSGALGSQSFTIPSRVVKTVTEPDGGEWGIEFDRNPIGDTELVTTVIPPVGGATTYRMNPYGGATAVTDAAGTKTTTWDLDHRKPKTETDAIGTVTVYEYDEHGNKTSEVRSRAGVELTQEWTYWSPEQFVVPIKNRPSRWTNARGIAERYEYSNRGQLTSRTRGSYTETISYNAVGDAVGFSDFRGNTHSKTYDGFGYVRSATNPEGETVTSTYDARGRMTSWVDEEGYSRTISHDESDRATGVAYSGNGGSTRTLYSDATRVRQEIDELGRQSTFGHDAMGRQVSVSLPDRGTSASAYDPAGNLTQSSDFRGNVTTYGYDAANRLVNKNEPLGKLTTYSYNGIGLLTSEHISGPSSVPHETLYSYAHPTNKPTEVTRSGGSSGDAVTGNEYDGNGNVAKMTDPEGRVTVYEYDVFDRLTEAAHPLGPPTVITRDGNGNKLTETLGSVTRSWEYDGANRPVVARDGNGNTSETSYTPRGDVASQRDQNSHVTSFTYDSRQRLTTSRNARGLVTSYAYDPVGNRVSESYPNGRVIINSYDAANRRTDSRDGIGTIDTIEYDADNNIVVTKDANGNRTTYDVNALNQTTEIAAPLNRTTTRAYSVHGDMLSETTPEGHLTSHEYDGLSRRTKTTLPSGSGATTPRSWAYDRVGNVLAETDSNGNTRTHEYDALNRRIKTSHPPAGDGGVSELFGYSDQSDLVSATDRKGVVTTYKYDNEHRRTHTIRAGVNLETNTYDPVGNRETAVGPRGQQTSFKYNETNQLTETQQKTGDGVAVWTNTITPSGMIDSTTDPSGVTTTFGYDIRDRQTSASRGGETTTQTFDGNGNRLTQVLPKGNGWTYRYDEANRLRKVESPSGFETVYGYNGDDALVSVRDANGRGTVRGADALGRTTSYEYPDGGVQTLSYDGEGNLRGMTQPNTGARSFDIDALNRTTGDVATGNGGSLALLRSFDPNGNVLSNELTGAFSGSGIGRKVTRVYDTLEHLRSEKTELTGGSGISPALDSFDATLTFTPDASGNRIGGTDAKGTLSTGTFDIADRPTSLVTSDGSVTLNWRRDGTLRSIEQSNGTTSTYDYDHAKRVKLITHRVGGVPSLTLAYDYDANGNRTDETRTEIALPGQPARTVHTHYGFDSDDRLTSAEVTYTPANPQTPNTRTVWTLDPVGNRLTEVVTNTQTNQALNSKIYTYNPRDQLETVTDSVTQLRVVYGYDLNGNRTQRTVTRGPGNTLVSRTFYRFDARDRLVKAEPEAPNPTNIPTVEFVYDAEDRKIARIETPWLNGNPVPANAQATISLYDGQTLLHEAKPGSSGTSNSQGLIITDTYRNSAKLDRHVSFGPNGTDQPTIRFYQLDALGTPLILTDSNGQAIVSNTLDAWGNTVQQTAQGQSTAPVNSDNQSQDPNQTGQAALLTNDNQSIGFTGYQKDEDLGLYYAGARFYDPLIGGFGAMDPWTGDTGRPITLNKYLYANGNPVIYVDRDGRIAILSAGAEMLSQWTKSLGNLSAAQPDGVAGNLVSAGLGAAVAITTTTEVALRGVNVVANTAVMAGATVGGDAVISSLPQFSQDIYRNAGDELMATQRAAEGAIDYIKDDGVFKSYDAARAGTVSVYEGDNQAITNTSGIVLGTAATGGLKPFQNVGKQIAADVGDVAASALKIKGFDPNSIIRGMNDFPEAQMQPRAPPQDTSAVVSVEAVSEPANVPKYALPYAPLSKVEKKATRAAIDARSATKEQYKRFQWDRRFDNRRRTGVRRFWANERRALREGSQGTRDWNETQRQEILEGNTPTFDGSPVEGHHRYNAADYPQLANDPNNIYPATREEHFQRWHGGNWQNDTAGQPVNPDFPEEF